MRICRKPTLRNPDEAALHPLLKIRPPVYSGGFLGLGNLAALLLPNLLNADQADVTDEKDNYRLIRFDQIRLIRQIRVQKKVS